jgi:hypothetical protein
MKAPAFRDDRDPPGKAIEAILRRPEVSSLQISFREDRALASMPCHRAASALVVNR